MADDTEDTFGYQGGTIRGGTEAREAAALPDDLRAQGWTVAVHNDYRLNGEPHTFWLFTKDGMAIKGEGRTDAEALNQCRDAAMKAQGYVLVKVDPELAGRLDEHAAHLHNPVTGSSRDAEIVADLRAAAAALKSRKK